MFVAVFITVGLAIVVSLHGYLWFRLVASTTTRGTLARRIGNVVMVVLPALLVGALIGSRMLPENYGQWLAWPGYLWLAMLFYLMLILLIAEDVVLLAWFVRWLRRRRTARAHASAPASACANAASQPVVESPASDADPSDPPDPSRRLFLRRTIALGAGLVSTAAVGYGVPKALGDPDVRRIEVRITGLPSQADGVKIALVTDIHLGPVLRKAHTERIVKTINDLKPDVVAIVGDLVDGTVAELGAAAAPLRDLEAPLGKFFVTGNHEYYSGYQEWIEELPSLGIRVLRNERVALEGFDLAGVNDATGGQQGDAPDYERALGGRDPSRPVVLLAHHPSQARLAASYGVDLQLSGHTHDGQMWPFRYLVALQEPVTEGLGKIDGVPVFVSRGAGFWGPPVRVGAPPDVALITLRSA